MKISRRTFLKTTAATAGSLAAFPLDMATQSPASAQATGNPIVIENQLPGTPNWLTTSPARKHEIEGYASQVSAIAGDTVQLFVSTTAATYTLSLYRLGWYGGIGARLIAQYGPLPGMLQATPTPDPTTGLVECQWQSQLSVPIPANWTTGSYLFRLERPDGLQSYIPLVIRSQQTADLLFQCSTTTYQAYNQWGGESLYASATGGPTRTHAFEVSFDRPYDTYDWYAPGAGHALLWEYPALRWLERQGYNLAYTSDNDTHANGASLLGYKAFLSVGHDEYWSQQMYNAVQGARDAGVSLMFLAANVCYWQIRFDTSGLGANRRIIGYKDYAYTNDPLYGVNNSLVTTTWRDPLVNRPENSLIGIMYAGYEHAIPYGPLRLTLGADPEFAGITAPALEAAPLIAGYEFDSVQGNGATPPGLEVLSNSSLVDASAMPGLCQSARYTAPSGARVFAAGSIVWSWGLDNWQTLLQGRGDQTCTAVQQLMTQLLGDALTPPTPTGATPLSQLVAIVQQNLHLAPGRATSLTAAVGGSIASVLWSVSAPQIASVDDTGWLSISSAATDGTQIKVTATSVQYPTQSATTLVTVQAPQAWKASFLAGTYNSGYADGPAANAQFMLPAGLTVDTNANVYVADTNGQAIRRIANATVATLAGGAGAGGSQPGTTGFKDGSGTAAQFNRPSGMVLTGGQIFLTDAFNNAIRTLSPTGNVTTYAGTGKQGFVDGPVAQAQFTLPTGIAADPRGFLYIADTANHAIRRISPDGNVTTLAGTGSPGLVDGPLGQSQLYYPAGLTWTNAGLVIADTGNHALRLLDSSNNLTTLAGTGVMGYLDGPAASAQFNFPLGVLQMPGGTLWITERGNNVVRSLDPVAETVSTVLGCGVLAAQQGTDLTCQFTYPVGLAAGPDGSVYLSDYTFVYHITSILTATAIAYLDLLPSTVAGSMNGTGSVTLNGVAAADTVVTLSTTNPAASVPVSVTIPAGSMRASFPITTQAVNAVATGEVIATANGVQLTAYLAVRPISVQSVILTPSTVTGGQQATCTVDLEAPAAPGSITVTLSSSNSTVGLPATLTIPAGATTATCTVTTLPVASPIDVSISALANGRTETRTLLVQPAAVASVSINPYTVIGGQTTTGTITLNSTAVANIPVALTNTNASATVPASVTVPAGSSSVNFTIATQALTTQATGFVTATANGGSANAYLVVRPIGPLSFNLAPTTVVGGQSATGTVTLEEPAAPSSITVAFSSSDSTVTTPGNLVIPVGNTVATGAFTTQPVTGPKTVLLTATANGRATSRTLAVQPISPSAISINPYTVLGGQNAVGTLTLNQAAQTNLTVTLSSSDPSAAVPASVTIPAGSTTATFTVTTQPVSSTTSPNITASANGVSATTSMTVRPMGPSTLTVSPSAVLGGQNATATVTLEEPAAPGSITVTFSASDGNATPTSSVTIPAGSTTGSANISTLPVSSTDIITITASANGRSISKTLTVQGLAPASVTITPSTVVGSTNATGTLTLNGVAGAGTVIALSSSNSAATPPSSVTVPAGSSSTTFTVSTQAVTSTVTGNIIASANGTAVNGYIAVRVIGPLSLALSPGTVTSGQSSTGTVTLEAPAAPGNLVATLTSSDPTVSVPGSVTIPAGNTTAAFTITTTAGAGNRNVLITVSVNGRATSKTLTIH